MRTQKRLQKNQNRCGILTFEWILLFTILSIGIVGGIAAMRDTVSLKYMQVGGAVGALNTGFSVSQPTGLTHTDLTVPSMSHTSSSITITPQN